MNNLTENSPTPAFPLTFWERIVTDLELQNRTNLEKLLAGCEIIAALDRIELIAA